MVLAPKQRWTKCDSCALAYLHTPTGFREFESCFDKRICAQLLGLESWIIVQNFETVACL